MNFLGKRTDRVVALGAFSDLKERRTQLNTLCEYENELRILLSDELCTKVLSVLVSWKPSYSILLFYQTASKKLDGLSLEDNYYIDSSLVFENDALHKAANFWNNSIDELACHFKWKINKSGVLVGV